MVILGVSCFYHDSAAALIIDGEVQYAAQEERFSRVKNDKSFPSQAVSFCLKEAGITINDVDNIVYYDKPFLSFERIVETILSTWPRGFQFFFHSVPVWMKEKIFIRKKLREGLVDLQNPKKIKFSFHHLSHAASTYYTSKFEDSAVVVIDGVGEWSSVSIYSAKDSELKLIKDVNYPHSLGLLYSSFTAYCGFRVNSGEYKLMGLAPYGDRESSQTKEFLFKIKNNLAHFFEDGSVWLDQKYFSYNTHLKMFNQKEWEELLGIPPRKAETEIEQVYCNLALAIQIVMEESVLNIMKHAKSLVASENVCFSGGVALNCVVNQKLEESGVFKNIFIQPACGDAGGALGAALAYYYKDHPKKKVKKFDPYIGPKFSDDYIKSLLSKHSLRVKYLDEESVCQETAKALSDGLIVGWFQGRMEWGPRALGARSILADPRDGKMQEKLNLKIKFRESFRPFAPSILPEDATRLFGESCTNPYMLYTYKMKQEFLYEHSYKKMKPRDKLRLNRSILPAITHLDYSSRVQVVDKDLNNKFYNLIECFKTITGIGAIINTSFNVRGEPIVCSPEDAINCFLNTEMDVLVMNNIMVRK